MPVWAQVVVPILALLVGIAIGFFVCRTVVKKEMDKNPPINREMIKALYSSMGRTPSEAQINAVLKSVNQAKNRSKKK